LLLVEQSAAFAPCPGRTGKGFVGFRQQKTGLRRLIARFMELTAAFAAQHFPEAVVLNSHTPMRFTLRRTWDNSQRYFKT
jgi:hypothetical protein